MRIKLYRSATVGIEFENFKLLMDPWLTDGEYYGSWSHYPQFDFENNLKEINSYDAIYIKSYSSRSLLGRDFKENFKKHTYLYP